MAFLRILIVIAIICGTIVLFVPSSLQTIKDLLGGKKDAHNAQSESGGPTMQDQFFKLPPTPSKTQLDKEVAGDSVPPEAHSMEDARAVQKFFYTPPPLPHQTKTRAGHGKPVLIEKKKIGIVPFYLITIDMTDPDSYIVLRLPNKQTVANSTTFSGGHETFESFVAEYPAAAVMNGTFFSKDKQERVMGNMVSEGKTLKYSVWENYGTTFSIGKEDRLEMVTARSEGKPNWDDKWFSLTCGPRLLKQGQVWLYPQLEGFTDPHVMGAGPRCAIGFSQKQDKLYLVNFMRGLTLKEEAILMKKIGCYEAMNLDGGASKSLAARRAVAVKAGRPLTNVLVVYDVKNKAPNSVTAGWREFQSEHVKTVPLP